MPSLRSCTTRIALLFAVCSLSACATHDYLSEMYQAGYDGKRGLAQANFDASADPDPLAITNGLYSQWPLQGPCYRCSPQSQFSWSSWSP